MKKALMLALCVLALGSLSAQTIDSFVDEFKRALKKKDKTWVLDHAVFPMLSYDLGPSIPVGGEEGDPNFELNRENLTEYYKKVFTKSMVKTALAEKPYSLEDLYGPDTYALVFDRSPGSTSWFIITKEDGAWRWTGTDNVSE